MPAWAGYYLNLDYSAKLFVLTFILVVLGSDHASGALFHYVFSFCQASSHGCCTARILDVLVYTLFEHAGLHSCACS